MTLTPIRSQLTGEVSEPIRRLVLDAIGDWDYRNVHRALWNIRHDWVVLESLSEMTWPPNFTGPVFP